MPDYMSRRNFLYSLAAIIAGSISNTPDVAANSLATIKFAFSQTDPPVSYLKDGESVGILPDLVSGLFELVDDYNAQLESYPWRRAKKLVERGVVDAFCTVPSKARRAYALFQKTPLYTDDFGYLIYDKENPQSKGIENVKSFEELKQYRLITERGSEGWESESVPDYVERVYAPTNKTMLNLCFKRHAGEFFIKSIYEAKYQVGLMGMRDKMGYVKVDFIPDSTLPFHIGISKMRPDAEAILSRLENVTNSRSFRMVSERILGRYV